MLDIVFIDWFRVVKAFREMERDAHFVGADIVIRGNNAATAVIDPLTHHMFAKETFLSLKNLSNSCRRIVTPKWVGILLRVHVAVYVILQLNEQS